MFTLDLKKFIYRHLKRENTPPEFFAVNFDRQFWKRQTFSSKNDMISSPP